MSWGKLAESVGLGEVWLASCGQGENCLTPDAAEKLGAALGLSPDVVAALSEPPVIPAARNSRRAAPTR